MKILNLNRIPATNVHKSRKNTENRVDATYLFSIHDANAEW